MKTGASNFAILLTVALCFLFLSALDAFAKAPEKGNAADLAKGKQIYGISCILCHGKGGMGDGPASVFIGPYSHPRPADFTRGTFKFRTTESGDLPTLTDLMRTIRQGIPGFMPSFKHLDEEGIRQVALYVANTFIEDELPVDSVTLPRPIEKKSAYLPQDLVFKEEYDKEDIFDEEQSRTSGTERMPPYSNTARIFADLSREDPKGSPPLGQGQLSNQDYRGLVDVLKKINRFSELDADRSRRMEEVDVTHVQTRPSRERGKTMFFELQCISCHGVNGKGHEAKTNMKDERGLPVMAADLTQPSSFGNGNTRDDIFRTIMTGLNGTPMPSFSDLFIGEEDRAWDLVEYVYFLQEDASSRFLP